MDGRGMEGPLSYRNWGEYLAGRPENGIVEYPLFSDARVGGEITDVNGPYELLNALNCNRYSRRPVVQYPVLILRAANHMRTDRPAIDWTKTSAGSYHGGRLEDEIAALVSLALGVRMMAGGRTRVFDQSTDPRGRPQYLYTDRDPVLPRGRSGNSVIPRLPGAVDLSESGRLRRLPHLSAGDAAALVQAARLYQDALWISDAQPELSWVMLVSAVEVAAGRFAMAEGTPSERLRTSKPDLAERLLEHGGESLLEQVADAIVDSLGATRKFVSFLQGFLPPPPTSRGSPYVHVSWDREDMARALSTIYRWRSRALHGGTPFPLPMCEPPYQQADVVWEKPPGHGTAIAGAVWVEKDTPMLLHPFEYIVRNSLLKWWDSLLPDPNEGLGTT